MSLVLTEELEPGILLVTLNRPERLNALSQGLIAELHATFERINSDRDVRVVILTGAGRGFCAGDDLKGVEGEHGAPGTEGMNTIPLIYLTQEHLAVAARADPPAPSAGDRGGERCGCRRRVRDGARLRRPVRVGVGAVRVGVHHARGVVVRHGYELPAPAARGRVAAAELMLTGRIFDAQEARAMDLVLDVVPDGDVVERALVTARQIVAHSPLAVWMTKETMWQTIDSPSFRHALDMENRTQVMCTQTGELADAAAAFREGRAPEWRPL